jgi:hypothetical protein
MFNVNKYLNWSNNLNYLIIWLKENKLNLNENNIFPYQMKFKFLKYFLYFS